MAAAPFAGHIPLFPVHLSFSAWTFLSCQGVLVCDLTKQSINGKQERRKLSSDPVPHSLPTSCLIWEPNLSPNCLGDE